MNATDSAAAATADRAGTWIGSVAGLLSLVFAILIASPLYKRLCPADPDAPFAQSFEPVAIHLRDTVRLLLQIDRWNADPTIDPYAHSLVRRLSNRCISLDVPLASYRSFGITVAYPFVRYFHWRYDKLESIKRDESLDRLIATIEVLLTPKYGRDSSLSLSMEAQMQLLKKACCVYKEGGKCVLNTFDVFRHNFMSSSLLREEGRNLTHFIRLAFSLVSPAGALQRAHVVALDPVYAALIEPRHRMATRGDLTRLFVLLDAWIRQQEGRRNLPSKIKSKLRQFGPLLSGVSLGQNAISASDTGLPKRFQEARVADCTSLAGVVLWSLSGENQDSWEHMSLHTKVDLAKKLQPISLSKYLEKAGREASTLSHISRHEWTTLCGRLGSWSSMIWVLAALRWTESSHSGAEGFECDIRNVDELCSILAFFLGNDGLAFLSRYAKSLQTPEGQISLDQHMTQAVTWIADRLTFAELSFHHLDALEKAVDALVPSGSEWGGRFCRRLHEHRKGTSTLVI